MKSNINNFLFVNSPNRVCVECKEEFKIPDHLFLAGKGWPKFYTPFCPVCQQAINEGIEKELIEKSSKQEKRMYKYRKAHLEEYLIGIGVPYPKEAKAYGHVDDIKKIANLLLSNKWIILNGTPGTGKSLMASMAFRMIAVDEEAAERTMLYRSITHLIGDVKEQWDESGFNTGESLRRECINASILTLEINDIENTSRTSQFRNEILFQIIDQRYTRIKKGFFYPTIYIVVSKQGQSIWKTLSGQGIDDAVIGRIIELGSENIFQFNLQDFRKSIAVQKKNTTIIK